MSAYLSARGAVVREAGGQVTIETIEVPSAEVDEVTIEVEACGLCHSDLHYIDGSSGVDFPYLLGHEVVGKVILIGNEVTDVSVGDRVIVALMKPCGHCEQCRRGRRTSCPNKMAEQRQARLTDGTPLTSVLGAGGLATLLTVRRQHVVTIGDDLPANLAAFLGCGVPTGYGAVINTAAVKPGDRVAVIGAGGVGLAAIAAARSAGASEVLAVDMLRPKLDEASLFGATRVHLADDLPLPTDFDVVIDAVGGSATLSTAVTMAGLGSTVVMAGAPTRTESGDIALREFFMKRLQLVVSHWGDCVPQRDLEAIQQLVSEGEFPLQRYLSETVSLDEAPDAYERLRRGEVLRSSVLMK